MKQKMILLLVIGLALMGLVTACGDRPEKAQPDAALNLPAPVLVSPDVDKTTGNTTPQFQWEAVVGATEYTFEIKNTADNSVVVKKTYTATSRCTANACKIPAPQELPIGEYKWHVVAWIGELKTDWSEYRKLTIK